MGTMPTEQRVPPQSIDAEKALLGSILLRPEGIYEIIDIVSAESFYSDKHRTIFETMLELFSKSDPIDLLSLSSRLEEKKLIEKVGGMSYLSSLANDVPSSVNLKHYAEIVQRKFLSRLLIDASHVIGQLGYDEAADIEEILEKAEKKIFEVTSSPTTKKFTALKENLSEAWDRLDTLHKNKGQLRGIPTGFKGLDNLLSGFQKSDLVILAGRPSMGKTALALDIARQSAIKHGTRIGIFSLEMSADQLTDRMLASESRVDAWKLRTGKLHADKEFQSIRDALDRLSGAPIYIDDQPGNNVLAMRSVARRLKSEKGLDLVIVDYLQLMIPAGRSRQSDSLVQQVTEISRSLKTLARELQIPVMALSQLSRAVEQRGGKPRLSDLRDSGSIEQDADVVMFVHREDRARGTVPEDEKTNIAEILVEKHRNGPTGRIELYFDDKKATFLDIDKQGHEEFSEEFDKEDDEEDKPF